MLGDLGKTIRACKDCRLYLKGKGGVPGVGLKTADIMAVGQAPGWEENREGVPFVGQAGQFLSAALDAVGIASKRVYFTNVVKHYPGKGRGGDNKPPAFAVEACLHYLKAEIEEVQPRIILAVGAEAMHALGVRGGIKQNHGKAFETEYGTVVPVVHPAYLMRNMKDAPIFTTALNILNTLTDGVYTLPERSPVTDMRGEEVGIDIETEDGKTWCVGASDGETCSSVRQWIANILLSQLQESGAVPVFHNAKYDVPRLEAEFGVKFDDWYDTLMEAHFLGYAPKGLDDLSSVFLGVSYPKFRQVVGTGKKARRMDDVPEAVMDFNASDAWATKKLHELWEPQMRPFREMYAKERKLTRVIINMEATGLPLNQEKLKIGKRQILRRMGQLEAQLRAEHIDPSNREAAGQRFWKHKRRIITTKTGELSTAAQVLRNNRGPDDDWIEPFIEWHQCAKFLSTYIENWEGQDWLHPSFNQMGTATWRFSCSNPNLQNVAKSKIMPLYQLFVAPEGCTFISADASQIELRRLANASGDRNMIEAYLDNRDLHDETVQSLIRQGIYEKFGIEGADPQRRFAKTVNFGISYGITDYGLSPRLGLPEGSGQVFIDAFYAAYPEVQPWQSEQIAHGEKYGYVTTMEGRPLYVPCMLAETGRLRHHGEKQCMNYPIQGGALEVIKDAMLRASEYLVCQVHDELLWLVPEKEVEDYKQFLVETLPDTRHEVPYTWDMEVGKTWGDIKHIDDIWEEDDAEDN